MAEKEVVLMKGNRKPSPTLPYAAVAMPISDTL